MTHPWNPLLWPIWGFRHPRTGERVWANMIMSNHASYFHQHPTFPELRGTPYTGTPHTDTADTDTDTDTGTGTGTAKVTGPPAHPPLTLPRPPALLAFTVIGLFGRGLANLGGFLFDMAENRLFNFPLFSSFFLSTVCLFPPPRLLRTQDSFPYPFHVRFGDGGEVPYATIQLLRALSWQHAQAYRPEAGDLLVVDNYLAQHSRLGYKGDRRFWIAISLD